ncbi:hypothetical protein BFJ63_vAg11534 [Fusarium oxysporum f. sp. narcissi]|uniref:Uncharacterized protein n=1 Tax=Fusarium oxysporum f. sp. narcissi TaxID=451672 RepID=A0A4Q2VE06_FUSOX|nr:hypothetical protein BFJ63_vAg11534 [Fusarium oxysporum f. sp. narcissi]
MEALKLFKARVPLWVNSSHSTQYNVLLGPLRFASKSIAPYHSLDNTTTELRRNGPNCVVRGWRRDFAKWHGGREVNASRCSYIDVQGSSPQRAGIRDEGW